MTDLRVDLRAAMLRCVGGMTRAVSAAVIGAVCISCANIGNPSGGPRDETPPQFVSANPAPGSLNVTRERISLTFDELINVKDAFSKVVVSPTGGGTPRVSSQGRRVTIDFDSLSPNTTYTVDFADAIEDNNEGNKLQGFAYTFSTGPVLDSLRISGRVLGARNLEPQQSMIVGVHQNLADSAFTTSMLTRIAKTDDRGRFTIRGLAPGSYRLFALGDKDNDYRYSSPEEDLAFYDFVINPGTETTIALDSLYNPLTGSLDTVTERLRTVFLPNDVVLRTFNSEIRQQYLASYDRLDSTRVFLKFNTESDSLPRLRLLGDEPGKSLGRLEASQKLDSLVWWLTPELMRRDSLKIEVSYVRSDQNLVKTPVADTLEFNTKRPVVRGKAKSRPKKISAADSIAALTFDFKVTTGSQQEVYQPVTFEVPVPPVRFDTLAVHLSELVDTVYRRVDTGVRIFQPDSLQPRRFSLDYNWNYGGKYRMEIDTLAATDIYGKVSRPLLHDFVVKGEGDYSTLLLHLSGLGDTPAFVELLNSGDALQRTAPVRDGDAYFPFLAPGRYFARVILDLNDNGKYDTGNYAQGRQPELAYYYPKAINIKKNWDKEESWAVFDTPVDMMKPAAVTKNKPASSSRNRNGNTTEEEDEEEIFDPTRNPFDPNDRGQRRSTSGSY